MAAVKIDKKIEMNTFEIVKFQLMTHCFVSDIQLNDTELNILSLLGTISGQIRSVDFCKFVVEKGYLGTTISVNNCLSGIEKSKLFLKKGSGKKLIYLNPDLKIISEGTVVLNYVIFKRGESKKAE